MNFVLYRSCQLLHYIVWFVLLSTLLVKMQNLEIPGYLLIDPFSSLFASSWIFSRESITIPISYCGNNQYLCKYNPRLTEKELRTCLIECHGHFFSALRRGSLSPPIVDNSMNLINVVNYHWNWWCKEKEIPKNLQLAYV